jgi:YbbR domain-containing protein
MKRNTWIFIICFFIAALLWLSVTLSRVYRVQIDVPIKYIYPENTYLITQKKRQTVRIEIEGQGFEVLRFLLKKDKDTLNVNLEFIAGAFQANLQSELNLFKSRFPPKITPVSIVPNKVSYTPQQIMRKKVPVIFRSNIHELPYYNFVVQPKLIPDSVWVYGTPSRLDRIQEWETQIFTLQDNQNIFQERIELASNPYNDLNIEKTLIMVQGVIGKYTEKTVRKKIQVVNIPDSVEVHLIPHTLDIYYKVPLTQYDKVTDKDFDVFIDYQRIHDNVSNATPEVFCKDKKVRGIQTYPNRVYVGVRKKQNLQDKSTN